MVQEFDNIKPARLLIRIMKLFGMWTFQESTWNRLYRFYGWILHFHFTFLFILAMYINVFLAQNLDDLSDALYMSLTEIALLVKVLNMIIKSQQAVHLLQIFENTEEVRPRNTKEKQIVIKAQQGFCHLRNLHVGGSMTALLMSFFIPFLNDGYILSFPIWIPFDYKNDKNYFYAYSYDMIAITVTAVSNYTLDLFQSYLLFQLSIYYKLLGQRLANFGYNGNENDEVLNEYFEFHIFVKRLTAECEKFLSFPILIQMILSAFVLCFTVYKLKNASFTENPSAFMMYILFAFVMSLQIYLPCNYGNELTTSAYELTNAVYSSEWTHLSLGTQKKIFIFMESLKHPVVVKAGKIFNIGLGVFSQTMNNAYRLYAVLLNIEN